MKIESQSHRHCRFFVQDVITTVFCLILAFILKVIIAFFFIHEWLAWCCSICFCVSELGHFWLEGSIYTWDEKREVNYESKAKLADYYRYLW